MAEPKNRSLCNEPGCEAFQRKRGYCGAHYMMHRRSGDLENLPEPKECLEPGCARHPYKDTRCWEHINTRKPKPQRRPCSFPDCGNASYREFDLCYTHYANFRSGKVLKPVGLRGSGRWPTTCHVNGCFERPVLDGACGAHAGATDKPNTCGVLDCGDFKMAYKVLCSNHNSYSKKFNISPIVYRDMVNKGCEICGSHFRMAIDHDHSCCNVSGASCGKCIRGALCGNCNNMLGHGKTPKTLRGGADYLEKWLRTSNSVA